MMIILELFLKKYGKFMKHLIKPAWHNKLGDYTNGQKILFLQVHSKRRLSNCVKKKAFLKYYDYSQGQRTSNMLDRLMKFQDRRLYCTQHFHGILQSANNAMRAHSNHQFLSLQQEYNKT